ncbi:MAG: tRNA threonylcarbamoyladenosine dehydratase [Bacteroidetes bacterium]|nr:tRNA threonylcarbamoyladenosine dehydratase [Bacteroidota bacterium]MBK7039212.1 tRNA threonylcarbamoyladenosine dehydratase [Bacteroidota bacterium]
MTSSPIWLERTELLINKENLEKLAQLNVLIVGLGGVGSFAAEFLARAGIGIMTIVDGDVVDITNTNRQLPALHSTVGKSKAVLMQERLLDINPALRLRTINQFINPEESSHLVNSEAYDYVLDCIDSVTPKLLLIKAAKEKGCKIISSMGAGGKVDSMMIKYADISKTHICPFAYYIRKRLRHEGIYGGVMTVFSEEKPIRESIKVTEGLNYKRSFYGTISYIPALFGLNMASWVVRDACGMFEPTPLCIPKKEKRRGE